MNRIYSLLQAKYFCIDWTYCPNWHNGVNWLIWITYKYRKLFSNSIYSPEKEKCILVSKELISSWKYKEYQQFFTLVKNSVAFSFIKNNKSDEKYMIKHKKSHVDNFLFLLSTTSILQSNNYYNLIYFIWTKN